MSQQPVGHVHAFVQRVNPATATKFDLFDCRCGVMMTAAEIAAAAKVAGVDVAADGKADPFLRLVGRKVTLSVVGGDPDGDEVRLLDVSDRGIVVESDEFEDRAFFYRWKVIGSLSWPMKGAPK